MATTALQAYGVPGRTRTFAAKAEAAVTATPACRTLTVAAYSRSLAVAAESRTYTVGCNE